MLITLLELFQIFNLATVFKPWNLSPSLLIIICSITSLLSQTEIKIAETPSISPLPPFKPQFKQESCNLSPINKNNVLDKRPRLELCCNNGECEWIKAGPDWTRESLSLPPKIEKTKSLINNKSLKEQSNLSYGSFQVSFEEIATNMCNAIITSSLVYLGKYMSSCCLTLPWIFYVGWSFVFKQIPNALELFKSLIDWPGPISITLYGLILCEEIAVYIQVILISFSVLFDNSHSRSAWSELIFCIKNCIYSLLNESNGTITTDEHIEIIQEHTDQYCTIECNARSPTSVDNIQAEEFPKINSFEEKNQMKRTSHQRVNENSNKRNIKLPNIYKPCFNQNEKYQNLNKEDKRLNLKNENDSLSKLNSRASEENNAQQSSSNNDQYCPIECKRNVSVDNIQDEEFPRRISSNALTDIESETNKNKIEKTNSRQKQRERQKENLKKFFRIHKTNKEKKKLNESQQTTSNSDYYCPIECKGNVSVDNIQDEEFLGRISFKEEKQMKRRSNSSPQRINEIPYRRPEKRSTTIKSVNMEGEPLYSNNDKNSVSKQVSDVNTNELDCYNDFEQTCSTSCSEITNEKFKSIENPETEGKTAEISIQCSLEEIFNIKNILSMITEISNIHECDISTQYALSDIESKTNNKIEKKHSRQKQRERQKESFKKFFRIHKKLNKTQQTSNSDHYCSIECKRNDFDNKNSVSEQVSDLSKNNYEEQTTLNKENDKNGKLVVDQDQMKQSNKRNEKVNQSFSKENRMDNSNLSENKDKLDFYNDLKKNCFTNCREITNEKNKSIENPETSFKRDINNLNKLDEEVKTMNQNTSEISIQCSLEEIFNIKNILAMITDISNIHECDISTQYSIGDIESEINQNKIEKKYSMDNDCIKYFLKKNKINIDEIYEKNKLNLDTEDKEKDNEPDEKKKFQENEDKKENDDSNLVDVHYILGLVKTEDGPFPIENKIRRKNEKTTDRIFQEINPYSVSQSLSPSNNFTSMNSEKRSNQHSSKGFASTFIPDTHLTLKQQSNKVSSFGAKFKINQRIKNITSEKTESFYSARSRSSEINVPDLPLGKTKSHEVSINNRAFKSLSPERLLKETKTNSVKIKPKSAPANLSKNILQTENKKRKISQNLKRSVCFAPDETKEQKDNNTSKKMKEDTSRKKGSPLISKWKNSMKKKATCSEEDTNKQCLCSSKLLDLCNLIKEKLDQLNKNQSAHTIKSIDLATLLMNQQSEEDQKKFLESKRKK